VHFVNEEIDGGAIVLQAKVPIFPGDTVEEIELRTREQEYLIYPLVIKWFVEDRLKLIENQEFKNSQMLREKKKELEVELRNLNLDEKRENLKNLLENLEIEKEDTLCCGPLL